MADTSVTQIFKTIARRSSTMVVTWEFAVEILLLHSILGAFPRTGRDVAALGALHVALNAYAVLAGLSSTELPGCSSPERAYSRGAVEECSPPPPRVRVACVVAKELLLFAPFLRYATTETALAGAAPYFVALLALSYAQPGPLLFWGLARLTRPAVGAACSLAAGVRAALREDGAPAPAPAPSQHGMVTRARARTPTRGRE